MSIEAQLSRLCFPIFNRLFGLTATACKGTTLTSGVTPKRRDCEAAQHGWSLGRPDPPKQCTGLVPTYGERPFRAPRFTARSQGDSENAPPRIFATGCVERWPAALPCHDNLIDEQHRETAMNLPARGRDLGPRFPRGSVPPLNQRPAVVCLRRGRRQQPHKAPVRFGKAKHSFSALSVANGNGSGRRSERVRGLFPAKNEKRLNPFGFRR